MVLNVCHTTVPSNTEIFKLTMVTSCNIQHLLDRYNVVVDGQWGRWSQWTRSGQYKYQENQRYRTRLCDSPSPTCEGNKCTGDSSQVQTRCESFKVIWINVFLVVSYINLSLIKRYLHSVIFYMFIIYSWSWILAGYVNLELSLLVMTENYFIYINFIIITNVKHTRQYTNNITIIILSCQPLVTMTASLAMLLG